MALHVGDFDAQPDLIKVFQSDLSNRLPAAAPRVSLEYFKRIYVPTRYLGSGSSGSVFSSQVRQSREKPGSLTQDLTLHMTPDGTMVVGHTPEIVGLKPFQVALKLIPLGSSDVAISPATIKSVRDEVMINNYLRTITVGRGSDVFTQTPYVKMFASFDVEMRFVELLEMTRGSAVPWDRTPFKRYYDFFRHHRDPATAAPMLINVQVFELIETSTLLDFIVKKPVSTDASYALPLLLHCLCTFRLFHQIIMGTHYDARPANWMLRKVKPGTIVRYPVAENLTFYIPSSATMDLIPVLGDFGAVLIDESDMAAVLRPPPPDDEASAAAAARSSGNYGRSYRQKIAASNVVLDRYDMYDRPNPDFDLQLFARQFLEAANVELLIAGGRPVLQLLAAMSGPVAIPPDNPDIKGANARMYQEFRGEVEKLAQSNDSEAGLRSRISFLRGVAHEVAWLLFDSIYSVENDILEALWPHVHQWANPYIIDRNSTVIDFDVRLGAFSGGTLAALDLSNPGAEARQPREFALLREARQARDDLLREEELAVIEKQKAKGKRPLGVVGDDIVVFDDDDFVFDDTDADLASFCWNCENTIVADEWHCDHCQEATYCSQNCMIADVEAHQRHESCGGGFAAAAAEYCGGEAAADDDKAELLREAKVGEEELKRRKVKPIKTSRFRRALRFLARQGIRLAETAGSAVGGIFGADTIVDVGVFAGIEFPMFIAPIVNVIKSGGDLGKFLKFFMTVRKDGVRSIGPFNGGIAGVEDTVQPMIDTIIAKNPAALKLLQKLCGFVDSIADKIAGSLASALEVIAVEFFGIARFTSYQALYGAFTKGSKKFAAVLRRMYEKIPIKARAWFEDFDMTVELLTKLKERFMKVINWMVDKAPGKLAGGIRRVQAALEKIPLRKLALALHSVLALGYVALLVRARCQ